MTETAEGAGHAEGPVGAADAAGPADTPGAPAPQGAPDDDALFVLTALMLTPAQFPGVLGDDYPQACAALGLEPFEEGYGLLLGQDGAGARWTVAVSDVALTACAIAAWDCGMEYELSPPEESVEAALPGWPLELAVCAPGVPAPHDPDPAEAGEPLTPPDTSVWGPAQRRLGADEIAAQWAQWRARVEEGAELVGAGEGDAHPGLRRVLEEAAAYTRTPPPPGRIRSAFASDGARTVRADGPGWSLVARTDDIALVLLDDEPGQVLPVGRGKELPGLLESLVALAAAPA
ncbi:hypothetical protein GCM10010406_07040 [Streptomyces thermolineatus]|uniref:Integral membrane protein n=2 Tax=Streptomyces thermolineatus TaxID=44033 RepID=A0ABN3KWY0_9ACTN